MIMSESGDDTTLQNIGNEGESIETMNAGDFSDTEGQELSSSNTELNQENSETNIPEPEPETKQERAFSQAEVDRIIRDRLEREKTQYENSPAFALIKRHAEMNNMSVDQYIIAVEQQEQEEKALALARQQNIPPHVAKYLQELENDKAKIKREQETQQEKQKQYREFFDEYPSVKPEEIPSNVWAEVNRGVPLVYAYAKHDNKVKAELLAKLQKGQSVQRSNDLNNQNSPQAVSESTGKAPAYFTREAVEKMSRKDTDKYITQILRDMATWKD
jgi:hypothetical protein